jgi:hypothetical protein
MANLGENFYPKLVQLSSDVGLKPEDLIAVMISESGLDPSPPTQHKATGLIGFMPGTLKDLGYTGTREDFTKLSGEQQLDYVKKFIKKLVEKLPEKHFSSIGQYYVGNIWPVGLQLPGVQKGNLDTPVLELNPEVKNGFSKKYLDIGIKITPEQEIKAYKGNPLKMERPGTLTLGDFARRIEDKRSDPRYQQAIATLQNKTNYIVETKEPSMIASNSKLSPHNKTQETSHEYLFDILNKYLRMVTAYEKTNKDLYKKYLPANFAVIKIGCSDYTNAIEFGRVLCSVLDEELMAKAFIHSDDNNVEVECCIHGPDEECFSAIKELTDATASAFKMATNKIGGLVINTTIIPNSKSYNSEISLKTAITQHRNFLLKFI